MMKMTVLLSVPPNTHMNHAITTKTLRQESVNGSQNKVYFGPVSLLLVCCARNKQVIITHFILTLLLNELSCHVTSCPLKLLTHCQSELAQQQAFFFFFF